MFRYALYVSGMYFLIASSSLPPTVAAGLEFRLAGEHKFPDDYPKPDELITVAGTFGAYSVDEGGHIACELQDAYFIN